MSNEHFMRASETAVQTAAPNGDNSSLIPRTTAEFAAPSVGATKFPQFSARVDPELLRQVKIEVATRGRLCRRQRPKLSDCGCPRSNRPGTADSASVRAVERPRGSRVGVLELYRTQPGPLEAAAGYAAVLGPTVSRRSW